MRYVFSRSTYFRLISWQAERAAREAEKASVDLDQCRSDAKLMNVMDQAVYDD